MARLPVLSFALCLVAVAAAAQSEQKSGSRTVLGPVNEYLSAGAEAIRAGQYDDGIRLTMLGLERPPVSQHDRAAALSNLCAAHAARREPDVAIDYCNQALAIDEHNWHAYSNRSYALYLKGLYKQASDDLAIAESLKPDARQVAQIRGMINERSLRARVVVEEHR